MLNKKIILALSLIPLFLLPTAVFGQIDYNTFFVDKDSYTTGEIVSIQGRILHDGQTPVTVRIVDPNGNLVHIDQTMPDTQGYFLSNFRIGGLAQSSGTYTAFLDYGDSQGEDTFQYIATETSPSTLATYYNEEYGFSFQYPSNWEKVILNEREPGLNYIAEFYDTQSNVIQIMYSQDEPMPLIGTDVQLVNQVFEGVRIGCESMTMERDGVICSYPTKLDGEVMEINGIKTIWILSKATYDIGDGYLYETAMDSTWFFISETDSLTIQKVVTTEPTFQNNIDFTNMINSVKTNVVEKNDDSNLYETSNTKQNIYVNDVFDISVVPPIGWTYQEFEVEVETEYEGVGIKTFFVSTEPNGNSLTPPRIMMAGMKTPEFSFDVYDSEQEALQQLVAGANSNVQAMTNEIQRQWEMVGYSNVSAEMTLLDSSMIYYGSTTNAKVYYNILVESNNEVLQNEKMRVDVWMSESGQIIYYIFVAHQNEFKQLENDFQKSVDSFYMKPQKSITPEEKEGGGCLIATATYGSELSPQVQQLRELRDNKLLQTESGQSFMSSFNEFYYLFSPYIADYERENPVFKEAVKVTLTPLLTSLSILNHVNLDSEESVLGYGISLIILNIGMYFVAPAMVIVGIRRMT